MRVEVRLQASSVEEELQASKWTGLNPQSVF